MNRLSLTVTIALFVGATAANAQFGSGIVFDPTQSGHAIVQIENEEQSLANEAQQIENGTKIFTNTVKIATTALQTYNTVQQQYNLYRQMMNSPQMLYSALSLPRSDLMLMQQISNTYGNSMGWLNASNTGTGAAASYQQAVVPRTPSMVPGYGTTSVARTTANRRAGRHHRHRRLRDEHQPASSWNDPREPNCTTDGHCQS